MRPSCQIWIPGVEGGLGFRRVSWVAHAVNLPSHAVMRRMEMQEELNGLYGGVCGGYVTIGLLVRYDGICKRLVTRLYLDGLILGAL